MSAAAHAVRGTLQHWGLTPLLHHAVQRARAVPKARRYAVTRRARCARTFSRLPQIAMLHQRADWFFDRS